MAGAGVLCEELHPAPATTTRSATTPTAPDIAATRRNIRLVPSIEAFPSMHENVGQTGNLTPACGRSKDGVRSRRRRATIALGSRLGRQTEEPFHG
jgi:hypothetical protein